MLFFSSQDDLQRTPLHMCAMAGNVETMQVLLAAECNITSVDSEQHTAVYWAIGVFIYINMYTSNAVPVLICKCSQLKC